MRVKRIFFSKSDPAKFWFRIMIVGLLLIYLWNAAFLYESGFKRWQAALFNSIFVSFVASLLSIFLGWFFSYYKYINEYLDKVVVSKTIIFFIDAIKSIPQVIGALTGYAILTNLTARDYNLSSFVLLILLSFILGLFLFVEAYDMFNERIAYYKDKDFISALRVLGMKESSIINKEIFYKNSRSYVIQKFASIFGEVFFLQASVDYIISVGLTLKTNLVSLPPTLGNLLARIDSKQDIFAIGMIFSNLSYIFELPFKHLQGLSAALTLVFVLICVYKIANALTEKLENK